MGVRRSGGDGLGPLRKVGGLRSSDRVEISGRGGRECLSTRCASPRGRQLGRRRRNGSGNAPNAIAGSPPLAVDVLTALGERDAAVADTEHRAGHALQVMTVGEGLTVAEAVDWCAAGRLTVPQAMRLRRLVDATIAARVER